MCLVAFGHFYCIFPQVICSCIMFCLMIRNRCRYNGNCKCDISHRGYQRFFIAVIWNFYVPIRLAVVDEFFNVPFIL